MGRICKDGINTDLINGDSIVYGIIHTQHVLSGRWKIMILWLLSKQTRRFGEIKSIFTDISQGSLTKQLRELEQDGFIERHVFSEIPPRVEYSLTEKGIDFLPILDSMEQFGNKHGQDSLNKQKFTD